MRPVTAPAHRWLGDLHRSLLARLALVVVALVGVTSAVLFLGIDHFVSRQFSELRQERLARLAERVREAVDEERRKLDGTVQLLVNDSDLRNSTYYHLYLAGEQVHPQAAIDRAAAAFNLDRIVLWAEQGEVIAAHGGASPVEEPERSGSRALYAGDGAWLVAQARLERDGAPLAWLQLVEPLAQFLERRFGSGSEFDVRLAQAGPVVPGVMRVPLDGEGVVSVDVEVTDTAAAALAEVKGLLAKVLLASGLVMALVFVLFLRWQLRPLWALHRAADAVGGGDFSVRLAPQGSREIAGLARAFNRMAEGLGRLREMEQQLRHQEQLAAIGRVAARVAHNINNPLSVIHNLARLMQRKATDDGQLQEDIECIVHQSNRAIHTVEQLLHYSRPLNPRRRNMSLGQLCREVAGRWGRLARVELSDAVDPQVAVDPLQFEEMIENLLDNAHDAAPGKTVLLSIGVERGQATVRVRDQGPGFSPAVREHLFEPFFTTKTKGSGLGLASALAIARAHGGDLALAEGSVSELVIRLPLDEAGPVADVIEPFSGREVSNETS